MQLDTVKKIRDSIKYDVDNGAIHQYQFRMVMLHDAALYHLRREIVSSMGHKRARGMFKRMGFASGCYDATIALKYRGQLTDMELFEIGPKLHSLEGMVRVEPVEMSIDIDQHDLRGRFIWHNSYEADICLRNEGVNEHPVCWMQIGYAMGFCSTLVDRFIYFDETSCRGKGDHSCEILGKPVEEWEVDSIDLEDFETDCLSDPITWLHNRLDFDDKILTEISMKIIGQSPALIDAIRMTDQAALAPSPVLFLGETGSGKELFARRLHDKSARSNQPFVAVNCAALPAELVESELFGVVKGAYTGADESRPGRFQRADKGTLFLDEIGELSLSAQAKLLRVIQEGEVERVGDTESTTIDVRIVAATHVDLLDAIEQGLFRADLYYRLNVFTVHIPPLRERPEDVEILSRYFTEQFARRYRKPITSIDPDCIDALKNRSWPGNIRELQNTIERLVILCNDQSVSLEDLRKSSSPYRPEYGLPDKQDFAKVALNEIHEHDLGLDDVVNELIRSALIENGLNISQTAKVLKMKRRVLDYRIKKFDLM